MPNRAQLTDNTAHLVDALLPAVLAAARVQMHYFRVGCAVLTKTDASPVTAADHESEALILQALAHHMPGVPVIAEEAAAAGHLPSINQTPDLEFFLVDPLDGTREFVNGRPEFTINIALVRAGIPRFGLIYVPATGQLFATLGNHHAIEAHIDATQTAPRLADLNARHIQTRRPPSSGLVAVASRSNHAPGADAFLGQYTVIQRTSAGSSLKFCLVAQGAADIYPRVGPTCEWDTAAGHAIVSAAGGSVTQLDGQPLVYGNAAAKFLNPDFVAWGRQPLAPQH